MSLPQINLDTLAILEGGKDKNESQKAFPNAHRWTSVSPPTVIPSAEFFGGQEGSSNDHDSYRLSFKDGFSKSRDSGVESIGIPSRPTTLWPEADHIDLAEKTARKSPCNLGLISLVVSGFALTFALAALGLSFLPELRKSSVSAPAPLYGATSTRAFNLTIIPIGITNLSLSSTTNESTTMAHSIVTANTAHFPHTTVYIPYPFTTLSRKHYTTASASCSKTSPIRPIYSLQHSAPLPTGPRSSNHTIIYHQPKRRSASEPVNALPNLGGKTVNIPVLFQNVHLYRYLVVNSYSLMAHSSWPSSHSSGPHEPDIKKEPNMSRGEGWRIFEKLPAWCKRGLQAAKGMFAVVIAIVTVIIIIIISIMLSVLKSWRQKFDDVKQRVDGWVKKTDEFKQKVDDWMEKVTGVFKKTTEDVKDQATGVLEDAKNGVKTILDPKRHEGLEPSTTSTGASTTALLVPTAAADQQKSKRKGHGTYLTNHTSDASRAFESPLLIIPWWPVFQSLLQPSGIPMMARILGAYTKPGSQFGGGSIQTLDTGVKLQPTINTTCVVDDTFLEPVVSINMAETMHQGYCSPDNGQNHGEDRGAPCSARNAVMFTSIAGDMTMIDIPTSTVA